MEKLKARKLRRLKVQKDGWEKAFQLISRKYKPSQKVEDIQRLLEDCGSRTANFIDRPIDTATIEELDGISKKFSIECKAQGRTTRQYYTLAKEQFEQVSKEYDEFEINYKKRQKKRREISLLVAGVIVVLTCSFIYLDGPKYLQAEKYMHEGNYEEAIELYSQFENNADAKRKIEEANYQIAEVYMHDGNYEAALEYYSRCESYLAVKEKENEARYQIAEAYMQDEKYSDALKWYTQCIDYSDAKNKAEEANKKKKEMMLQSLGLEENSLEEIYTLGNEIPCGLVKYSISYDNLLNANTDDLVERTDNTLTYGNYSLYEYSCVIKYHFTLSKQLIKIEVLSPNLRNGETFADTDIERVANKIEEKLNKKSGSNSKTAFQYKIVSDNIVYLINNSEEYNNQFRLVIMQSSDS